MTEFNGLHAGQRVSVARRVGTIYGLRTNDLGQFAYVQYDDGFSQWVPISYVEVLS
jgi:hypothetical protein